jgi:hypothetical protein
VLFRCAARGAALLAIVALAACGGDAGSSSSRACALVERLDETAATVAAADVSDPEAFERTLADAVTRYADTVRELKDLTPPELAPDLDRLLAAVQQRRFHDAIGLRASLDTYAASRCGRSTPSSIAGSPPSSIVGSLPSSVAVTSTAPAPAP